ncbi:flavodoxin family protein [Methanoplanus sp. FWC-SCC4]|uniref:Flavodoxin family protein n=1 Tax=Methanochimaera problematica TaxID=2609417 RepID=A0AA97FDH1_9EURY|nr:flavodoxin family protein [Methanoplanus sp. FWC-SCC4]WOF16944.1 flavodoxin family protein [Methanoplanus sp. FWC-SCC4]
MVKVVAFNASPRKDGNTKRLLDEVIKELEAKKIETEIIQIGGQRVHGCTACMKCLENQDEKCVLNKDFVNECIQKMKEADGIIIGTPTYFADVSTEAKALIDRAGFVAIVNGGLFKRKVGAAVVAVRRAGAVHAYDTINHFFGINNMVTVGSSYWNLGIGFEAGDVEKDEEGIQTMRDLGNNMAWLLKKISD